MKIILLSFAVLMSVNYGVLHAEDSRASALPATNAILTQDDKRNAIISYTIEQVPAIVTLAIQTNTLDNGTGEWVDIGGENVQMVSGDAN
jgi:hypothetical protein